MNKDQNDLLPSNTVDSGKDMEPGGPSSFTPYFKGSENQILICTNERWISSLSSLDNLLKLQHIMDLAFCEAKDLCDNVLYLSDDDIMFLDYHKDKFNLSDVIIAIDSDRGDLTFRTTQDAGWRDRFSDSDIIAMKPEGDDDEEFI